MATTLAETINLPRLNSKEHKNYHQTSADFISAAGLEAINVSEALFDEYTSLLIDETDMINLQRASQYSKELALLDEDRDDMISYVFSTYNSAQHSPIDSEQAAYKHLKPVMTSYKGIARLPLGQKTTAVEGLILDLEKEENRPFVTTLRINIGLSELNVINKTYRTTDEHRTQETQRSNLADIRVRMDEVYTDIVNRINASAVLTPSDSVSTLINNINTNISKTQAAYKQRGKRKTKQEPEQPTNPDMPAEA